MPLTCVGTQHRACVGATPQGLPGIGSTLGRHWVGIGSALDRHWVDIDSALGLCGLRLIQIVILMDTDGAYDGIRWGL